MRGNVVKLKMLGKSKKQFTEWDEAIFLAAFQVFEDAINQEPKILSRFRYKPESDLAIKLGYVEESQELKKKVSNAEKLFKWWIQYKKRYKGDYRTVQMGEKIQQEKLKELADVFAVLWD